MRKSILLVFLVASILVAGCMGGNGNGKGKGNGNGKGKGNGNGNGHGNDHGGDGGGLKMGYYEKRCGSLSVEETVRDIVWSKVAATPSLAAKLLRLHYHDCFVRGCDGSILLDPTQNTTTEKTAGPNRSVSGYEVIDAIKTKLETSCPGIVSCADIVALAARDAVSFQFRREMWPVLTGRKDGKISLATEVGNNLPSANANFTTLLAQFAAKKLNLKDLVTLSGMLSVKPLCGLSTIAAEKRQQQHALQHVLQHALRPVKSNGGGQLQTWTAVFSGMIYGCFI